MNLFHNDYKTTVEEFQGKFRFLSNFYPAEIEVNGYKFATSEHAYQAFKWDFATVADREFLNSMIKKFTIDSGISAGKAKRMGKKIPVDPQVWDAYKETVMKEVIYEKFKIPELREWLKATRHLYLQEGNYWGDVYWGVDLRTGKGNNRLGNILMDERNNIILMDELNKHLDGEELATDVFFKYI